MEKTCTAEESGAGQVPNGVRFDLGCSPRAAPAGGGRASCFGRSERTRVLVETHMSRDLTERPEDGWGPHQKEAFEKSVPVCCWNTRTFQNKSYFTSQGKIRAALNSVFYWKKLVINILNNLQTSPFMADDQNW